MTGLRPLLPPFYTDSYFLVTSSVPAHECVRQIRPRGYSSVCAYVCVRARGREGARVFYPQPARWVTRSTHCHSRSRLTPSQRRRAPRGRWPLPHAGYSEQLPPARPRARRRRRRRQPRRLDADQTRTAGLCPHPRPPAPAPLRCTSSRDTAGEPGLTPAPHGPLIPPHPPPSSNLRAPAHTHNHSITQSLTH
jgi:hypothetical protein